MNVPPAARRTLPAAAPDAASSARRRLLLRGGAWLTAAALPPGWAAPKATTQPSASGSAPAWPVRPLRLVVGHPQGASADDMARALAGPLAALLGQPVEVDNRPGAAGLAAAAAVAHADDDHTVGLMPGVHLTVARLLHPALAYDPLTDLRPVALVAIAPLALCVAPQLEVRGNAALQAIRRAGVAWQYGSPGVGTPFHLGMEALKAAAGWQALHVSYPGNPQVINALLQGDVQLALLPPSLAVAQWRAARLPVVALTSPQRSALMPGVPTLAERGVSEFAFEHWYALAAPLALAPEHAGVLARALRSVVRAPSLQQRLAALGWQAAASTPQVLARRIAAEVDRLRPVIQRLPIRTP
ncbi:Tripartite tricarboxylate transporter family receptor [Tepidimonas thermarum]|uniref:Tripartite tricarboxylate transporter family receptor n=1 Tax=Tepidimonas thermarum TaxID=335431 RepID=A0A554WYD4_9BURK|nr:tripartite tricarboxylate transporter substrate-binding protein [Tepidimonas thermarum]TSE28577.1 Tripartite tricarboxylate transporter family receptor [Tepidimonas thermarum]